MDIVVKEAIVDELTRLVNGGKPLYLFGGICFVIRREIKQNCCHNKKLWEATKVEWDDIMRQTLAEWNKWSGSYHYPIPAGNCSYDTKREACRAAGRAFDSHADKWDRSTEYGALRLELCQLLLDALVDSGN